MNNSFESDREFREWQAAVAMQYGIKPVASFDSTSLSEKNRANSKRLKATPRRRVTDKKVKV
jgi:hypothetical protein